MPGGDAAIGLIAPQPGKAALAIVIDVTGKLPQANEMLQKATARQLERGGKRSELKVEGCPDVVIQFDLPEPEEEKEAAASTLRGSAKSEADKGRRAGDQRPPRPALPRKGGPAGLLLHYRQSAGRDRQPGRHEGHFGPGDGPPERRSLADHKPFQAVVQRCRTDYGNATPQIRWFIHPLGYAEAARAATPENQRRKGKSILEVMRNQGVGGRPGHRRVRRLRRGRLRVGAPHGDLCPAALRKIHENGRVAQPDRFCAPALGAAQHRHLHDLLLRHSQRLRPLRVAVRRAVWPGRDGRVGRRHARASKKTPTGRRSTSAGT